MEKLWLILKILGMGCAIVTEGIVLMLLIAFFVVLFKTLIKKK